MTIEKEGYDPASLGKSSAKFIYATCRFCGEPSRMRKGFYNKSGSACHKECRFKEQSLSSPFSDPDVREKSAQTNLKRYGNRSASASDIIAAKISNTKKTEESRLKSEITSIEKYGTANPASSDVIKKKIKDHFLNKYKCQHPMQTEEVQQKTKNTLLDRYGINNLMDNVEFKASARDSFSNMVKDDEQGNYVIINFIRSEGFWNEIKSGLSLRKICSKFNLKYQTLASTLSKDEFKDRFREIYSYPKHQKQNELTDFVKSLGLDVTVSDRSIISPKEIDIFVPEKKLGIELNGSYWHSEAVLSSVEARTKHYKKMIACENKNIRLMSIFEYIWDSRRSQVENFLRATLGKNETRLDARKCKITTSPCPDFIEDNHIQGFSSKTTCFFNLEFEDKVVGTMTSSRHHRQGQSSNMIVLNRMCFAKNITIRGGATRLFSAFKKWASESGYDRIISFSDSCWTTGGIYETLGFVKEKSSDPDYFYWDMVDNKYVSKQSQKKSSVNCPEGLTEREWCLERGLYRIWDCGKKLWVFDLKKD